jgi:hypothetical protein
MFHYYLHYTATHRLTRAHPGRRLHAANPLAMVARVAYIQLRAGITYSRLGQVVHELHFVGTAHPEADSEPDCEPRLACHYLHFTKF